MIGCGLQVNQSDSPKVELFETPEREEESVSEDELFQSYLNRMDSAEDSICSTGSTHKQRSKIQISSFSLETVEEYINSEQNLNSTIVVDEIINQPKVEHEVQREIALNEKVLWVLLSLNIVALLYYLPIFSIVLCLIPLYKMKLY